jgi:hypothetical protein
VNFFSKTNLNLGIKKALATTLFLVVALAFIFPFTTAQAQTTEGPRGRVLQATSACESDGVTLKDTAIRSGPYIIGQVMALQATVKPECAGPIGSNLSHSLNLYNGPDDGGFGIFSKSSSGLTSDFNLAITPDLFTTAGDHQLTVKMLYGYDQDAGRYLVTLRGTLVVNTGAASTTGDPSLAVVPDAAPSVGVTSVTYKYAVTYVKAGGPDATVIQYDCGLGIKQNATAGSKIECSYPKSPKEYTIVVQAMQSVGGQLQAIPKAEWTTKLNVTGTETNQLGQDNTTGNPLIYFINFTVGGVLKFFIAAMAAAVGVIGTLLEAVLSIRTFSDDFAQVIYPAWEIFRNLGNILFILAIVAIGVATVFRINGYAVKDLLVKLIIGAILINFSLTIAQAILGIADTLQQQFLPDNTGAVRAIVNPLFVSNIWSDAPGAQLGDFSETIRIVTQFFISFAAFFAILAITILVCVRVVALWLLLMLSPIPYVASIFPKTGGYSKDWWNKFINWALVTPAVGFMLNLTALMTVKNRTVIENLASSSQKALNESWLNSAAFSLASNVIPLVFLYMTLKVATSFGSGAGGFVTKTLNKTTGMAFAPAAALGGYAAGAVSSVGKAATTVAKTPIVLAQAGVDKLKDNAKIKYYDNVEKYLGPKNADGTKGWKGVAFNAATGGSVWEAAKKKRKSDVQDRQNLMGAYAKDARSLRKGETPKAVQAMKDSDLAKAQKDKKEDVRDNTAKENTENLAAVFGSAASSFAKTVELLARTDVALDKGSFDDMKKRLVEDHLNRVVASGGPGAAAATVELAAIAAGKNASIEHFYEAGAAAGLSRRNLEQLRDKVNAKMISDGKLDNVIDPVEVKMVDGSETSDKKEFATVATHGEKSGDDVKVYTDAQQNSRFRKKRWEKKSANEQAANMHADMFADPVLAASFMAKWNKLKESKQNDVIASLSKEKLRKFVDLYSRSSDELDAALGKEDLTAGEVAELRKKFKADAGF